MKTLATYFHPKGTALMLLQSWGATCGLPARNGPSTCHWFKQPAGIGTHVTVSLSDEKSTYGKPLYRMDLKDNNT
jgi:hypothetical protein